MRVWTNITFRALDLLAAPEPAEDRVPGGMDVKAVLHRAALEGAQCSLSRLDKAAKRLTMEAHLEKFDGRTITIGRPVYRPGQKGLASGETLAIRIGMPEGCYLGETRVIAKFAPEGEHAKRITYRLAKPAVLVLDERRGQERVGVAFDSAPRAEILCAPRHKTLGLGHVVDLSVGGMRLACGEHNVRAGDRVLVRAKLNEDIQLHAMGVIVHAGMRDDGSSDIGVRFQNEQLDVERFIRTIAPTTTARRA